MLREILFRAERVSGGLIESITISRGTIRRKSRLLFMEIGDDLWTQIIPESLSQFTGKLTTCKKNKLFENDRVIFNYGRHSINENGNTRSGVIIYEDCSFVVKVDDSEVRVPFSIIHEIELF